LTYILKHYPIWFGDNSALSEITIDSHKLLLHIFGYDIAIL